MFSRLKSAPASGHWSKEFVEHLRAVHFAVIAVSIGLLVLLSSRPYNADVAANQIDEILDLQTHWSPDWLRWNCAVTYEEAAGQAPPFREADPFELPIGKRFYARVHLEKPGDAGPAGRLNGSLKYFSFPKYNWYWRARDSKELLDPNKMEQYPFVVPQERTLTAFEDWWDSLRRYDVYFMADLGPSGTVSGPPSGTVSGPLGKIGIMEVLGPDKNDKSRESDIRLELVSDLAVPTFRFVGSDSFVLYEFTSDHYFHADMSQDVFRPRFSDWRSGDFATAFPDLEKAAKGREGMDMVSLKTRIREEAAKAPEAFEAFGLKFPAAQLTPWGIVVLIGVQLYLFVYLRQLFGSLRPDDPGWDVPWIGMSQSRIGQLLFFSSLVVFPIAAAARLAWQGTLQLTPDYWVRSGTSWHLIVPLKDWTIPDRLLVMSLVAGFVFSAVVAAWSWTYRPKMGRSSARTQLFE